MDWNGVVKLAAPTPAAVRSSSRSSGVGMRAVAAAVVVDVVAVTDEIADAMLYSFIEALLRNCVGCCESLFAAALFESMRSTRSLVLSESE